MMATPHHTAGEAKPLQQAFALAPHLAGSGTFLKGMDLRETTRLLRRRLQIVVRLTVLCAALGLVLSLVLTPQYKANVVLLLDPRQAKIMDIGSSMSGLPGDNAALRSEIDIITSRAVIDRVIDKNNLIDDPEFSREATSWGKGLGLFKQPDEDASPETQAAKLEHKRTVTAEALQKKLDVSNDGRSLSIKLSFISEDPKKAAAVANSVADEYLVDQLEAKYEVIARANKWLSERLATLRKQVESTERTVEDYRQKNNLILIDGDTVVSKQLEEINMQLITARGQTSQTEARLHNAQSMVREGGTIENASDVLSSPLIQKLREQEAEVRRKEAELATRYGERHPTLINARAERQDLQRKIQEEVQKILRSLSGDVEIARAKENQLQQDLSRLESKAGGQLKSTVQLRQLQRDADANRTLYENFLARFKQTSEQQDMQLPDTRIIARADEPVAADFPQKWLFLMIGAMFGGVLGIIAAYVLEFLDHGYRTTPQLEEGTGLPVVGQIPSLKRATKTPPEKYVLEKPLSSYTEALRTVRTAIHFSNVDNPPRSVMVTSSGPGEGKTTFCLSLARTLASSGNKILLIDADMRRPRIARMLGIRPNGKDLAALITGTAKFDDVRRRDGLAPKLDVIPAFGRTPNAQDLLSSKQMQKIMAELVPLYDLVIIDTPPILAVADAAMISRVVDTNLFVVKWAETARDTVTQALKQLKTFDCRIAGAILNQVNLNELARYGEGYHSHKYHAYYTD